ncbi:MAG: 4-hydroxy-3-methylbut-2-enyl diphosphate reductase [Myxococcota bacterium]
MQILLANPRGFCAGVDRAIEIVELALARYGPPVYVRHEIVHNRHVVEDLRARGAIFIEDPEEAPVGSMLIFSAHGVSPEIRERSRAQELHVIDATCPLVTKVHRETLRIAKREDEIILVGHAGHVEVEGTLGHAPTRVHLVENVKDVERLEVLDPERLGCVTQTTLSVDDTREILAALRRRFPNIALPRKDDICYATQNRQNAVKQLAERAQLVLVVGAPTSSNSQRLVEVAKRCGSRAQLVEEASQIDPAWLEGVDSVGVTAGASAPEALVDGVVEHLKALTTGAELVEFAPVDEGMVFQLPSELR